MRTICIGLLTLLVGCALVLEFTAEAAATPRFSVLHSFGSGEDGLQPQAGLINVKGTLYGTTFEGGSLMGGTVFSLDPNTHEETVLHSFCGEPNCATVCGARNCTDGSGPLARLIDVGGTLYGTTYYGGLYEEGTVFGLTSGKETFEYSFCSSGSCAGGAGPEASLIDVQGTLYGTTYYGGLGADGGYGTVFALDPNNGAEEAVYLFCPNEMHNKCPNGLRPLAGLIEVNGMLYGTTSDGGSGCKGSNCGTVFALDPSTGVETVLHSFSGGADGKDPEANLIEVNGVLYGTTVKGGNSGCYEAGCGTVFALNLSTGTETVLHTFGYGTDGQSPYASLINVRGALYGTTQHGGVANAGTVFALNPITGAEMVVYSFCKKANCPDGALPQGGLIDVKGTLYGTTTAGGAYNGGTVFALEFR